MADHYLRRNPHVVPPPTTVYIPRGEDASRLFPAAQQVQRFKLSGPANNVTAACGLGIYRDTLLGAKYQGNAFTCEPVNLLVHRMRLEPLDTSFIGHRADDEGQSEFLAGTDDWFRPVQAITGPDGGLWVVDMYRFLIEHPRWIPPEDLAQIDVRAGHTMGRVYRVRPKAATALSRPRLDTLDDVSLAAALDSDNGWQRDLAGQMLVWKFADQRPDAVPPSDVKAVVAKLAEIATKSARPVARLQAVCVLDQLDQLTSTVNLAALGDKDPRVRRHAVRVSERHLANDKKLAGMVASLIDSDPQVSLQQAYTLAALPDVESGVGLYMLAETFSQEPRIVAAAMSSLRKGNIGPLLEAAIVEPQVTPFHQRIFAQFIGQAIALRATGELPEVIRFVARPRGGGFQPWQFDSLAEILAALGRQGKTIAQLQPETARNSLQSMLAKTLLLLKDEKSPSALRMSVLRVIGRDSGQRAAELEALSQLFGPQTDPELQARVVETLGRINSAEVPGILVKPWASLTPARQSQVLDLLLSRPAWTKELLQFVEEQQLSSNQIDAVRRQRLLSHADTAIRNRAEKLLAGATNPDRLKVLDAYREAATLAGDATRGQGLFTKTCAACHKLGAIGQPVGPDLAALANKSPQFLLQEILDPNRNVDSRYVQYTAVLQDGRIQTGLLINESDNSLTLKSAEGKDVDILRSDIEEIVSSGKSLMPEGLERDLNPVAVADIIAFVTRITSPAKQFPGNTPALITVVDGRLSLLATQAEIRGDSILFEEPFQNVGYWHGMQDHVTWNVRLEKSGDYDVYFDFSCAPDSAGNEFQLAGVQPPISGKVSSTGGWDRYRQQKMGTVTLSAGDQRVVLRPAGQGLRGALFDLKGIHFVLKGTALALAADVPPPISTKKVRDLVALLLDAKTPPDKRQEIIAQNPALADELISGITDELTPGGPEEYKRIPLIWQIAIAAGKRNDLEEIRSILDVTVPQPNQPLHDWRAVVIGGGIINGISLTGVWPHPRIQEILKDQTALTTRWQMALDDAAKMAEDVKIPTGTRYDALRMVALDSWDRRGAQLQKYLAEGVDAELQMGAISGLVDVDRPEATKLLIGGLPHFNAHNRQLAIGGLLRGETRQQLLITSIQDGTVQPAWITTEHRAAILKVCDETQRMSLEKLFGK